MITRPALISSTLLLLAGAFPVLPASAQYYYGPGYGYAPRGYGPPPGPYSYNAPPPQEYGRPYDDDYPAARAPRPISARAVIDRLEELGYEEVGRPRFTGTLYIVQATGPGGMRQQIVVDAIRGIILNRTAVAGPADPYGGEDDPHLRRSGARPLDSGELYRQPSPRPRREAARPAPAPLDSGPPQAGSSQSETLPPPADPRLAEPPAKVAPRPFEGRAGNRQARTETRSNGEPVETGARPFGLNPGAATKPKAGAKDGDGRKAAQPPAPQKKPVAEARPAPAKSIRVIPGVTPLNAGGSKAQLDNLPQPPDTPAPTGE